MSILAALGLPHVADDAHAKANAESVRAWLAAVAGGAATPQEFDRAIEHGKLLFEYVAVCGHKDEFYPVCCAQIDRRMALRGLVHCRWRGWIPRVAFDAWRWDRAQERADAPRKGER